MIQLEMPGSEQKIRALGDRLQDDDHNRRRPGRADDANPNLTPLLRAGAVPCRLLSDEVDPPYGLKHTTPMLGIAVSVILSIPLWSVIGFVAWAILR